MSSPQEQLQGYREAAGRRHKLRKKYTRAGRRASEEMRQIAMSLCGGSAEGAACFAELLSEAEPGYVRRWAAFHLLEMCQVDDAREVQAIRAIEEGKSADSFEAVGEDVCLRRLRASRGTREQAVAALGQLPVDLRASRTLSPVDLVRASRYKLLQPGLSVDELETCLHSSPELADAWLLYSEDQRCSPAWFVAERSPDKYAIPTVKVSGSQTGCGPWQSTQYGNFARLEKAQANTAMDLTPRGIVERRMSSPPLE